MGNYNPQKLSLKIKDSSLSLSEDGKHTDYQD